MSAWGERSNNDLLRLKWLLGGVLALISLWTASSLGAATDLQIFVVSALILFAMFKPGGLPNIPATAWRGFTGLMVLFAVGDFVIAGASFLEPLVRLVVFILLIRGCTFRTRREDLQILLLSMFLLVLTGVLTVSLLFAGQIILFTPVAMLFLFITNLAEEDKDRLLKKSDWLDFSWVAFARRLRVGLRSRLAFAGLMTFFALFAIAGVIFVLIPRFQLDQNIPFLQVQAQARSGFTETIEFGEVTEITEDNSVALRIDAPSREAIPDNPYWRMLVADYYDDGRFIASQSMRQKDYEAGTRQPDVEYFPQFTGLVPEDSPRVSSGAWTFYMEGNVSRYLPHLGPFLSVRFPKRHQLVENTAGFSYRVDQVSASVFSYQIESMVNAREHLAHPIDLVLLPTSAPIIDRPKSDIMQAVEYPLTQLSIPLFPTDYEILQRFVSEINNGQSLGTIEFVESAIRWLQRNHGYSLKPVYETEIGDPLIRWMESKSGGHCELFAGALVLLCRAEGIPARVAVGFSGGSWNPVEEYFIIRNRNAHAWVEIFLEDRWQRWDPTPGAVNSLDLPQGQMLNIDQMEAGWEAWVDSMRIAWYRRIVNFDQASQEALVKVFTDAIKTTIQTIKEDFTSFIESQIENWVTLWEQNLWLRVLMVTALVFLIGIMMLKRWMIDLLRLTALRRWMRSGTDEEAVWRRRAGRVRIRFMGFQKDHGTDEVGAELLNKLDALRFSRAPSALSPERTLADAQKWMLDRKRAVKTDA
ncbi:MAG: transglutaminaseTgpA domain-containing protein [Opitutales bacterium]|nr:transglutaminaseTgpA domain-containing protein [Opitutales bacterium]